jgi:hypothetical protein
VEPSVAKKEPMIKSKGIAALISLFFPGVGLALCNPSRMVEGIAVFIIAIILDVLAVLIAMGGPFGGQILGAVTGCCLINLLSFGLVLGLFLIPLVHIIGAIHTYVRG